MKDQGHRVCLMTGAAGRLGTAFCEQNRSKYDLIAAYHRRAPGVTSQHRWFVDPLNPDAELAENERPVYAVRADLTKPEDVRRLVEVGAARFGTIDVVINLAAWSSREPVLDVPRFTTSLEDHFELNVLAPFRVAAAVADVCWRGRYSENHLRRRNIINVSSTAGVYMYPGCNQAAYSTSKAALISLTCHMAHEFGALGVRVNVAAPNTFPEIVSTEQVLEGMLALDAGTMTGTVLVMDEDGNTFE